MREVSAIVVARTITVVKCKWGIDIFENDRKYRFVSDEEDVQNDKNLSLTLIEGPGPTNPRLREVLSFVG
jgi:hypothetical protein